MNEAGGQPERAMATVKQLSDALAVKTAEIEQVYAVAMEKTEVDDKIRQGVAALIQEFEEADYDGEFGSWLPRDARLAWTPIGRLLQERHELQEQILDPMEE